MTLSQPGRPRHSVTGLPPRFCQHQVDSLQTGIDNCAAHQKPEHVAPPSDCFFIGDIEMLLNTYFSYLATSMSKLSVF